MEKIVFLTFTTLWAISRRQIGDIFLTFPSFKQIVSICMKCQILFLEKQEQYFKMLSAENVVQSAKP